MQLTTLLTTASAVAVATATRSAVTLNADVNLSQAYARVINRCDYDVHLWSVYKGDGCPTDGMVTLKTGETYAENYNQGTDATGVSIKISKTDECKGNDIVQLEYYLEHGAYAGNYLDVSYVDCENNDCPTRQEGYYLVAGNQTGAATAGADNTWCPVMSCSDPATCDKISYVLPDDVQTKTCDVQSSMDFYMCGSEAPSGDDSSAPASSAESSAAASSTEQVETSTAAPTSASSSEAVSVDLSLNVAAAAITAAPSSAAAANANVGLTKTKVVYVTAYEYVNAKRHAHGHARRHQPFHA